MKRVLVVVGTPGVGKSSVSAYLASRLQGIHIDLSRLIQQEGYSCGLDKKRKTLIADLDKAAKRVKEIISQSEGYVIVDGHFAMDVVQAKNVFLAFVLRRNPDELQEILRQRGFGSEKITENVAAEILDVCLFETVKVYGKERICEVDVSCRAIEDVVEEIMEVIENQKKCRVGVVDWLAKLEREDRLGDFLV